METFQKNAGMQQEERVFSRFNIQNYCNIAVLNIFIKGLGYTLIDSYFTYFYSEFLGVPAAVIAAILSVGIVLDGVSDMAMGIVIDKVITRLGKAKHWLIWMGIPCGLSMVLIFLAPQNASILVKSIYAAITYNLYCCCMTAVRIPSQAICSLSSDNDKVRTIFGWFSSNGSALAGVVTSAVLVSTLQAFGGESIYAYRMTQLVFSIATAIVILISGFVMHEKRSGDEWKSINAARKATGGNAMSGSLKEDMKYILCNRYWWIYLGFHFFESCIDGVISATLAYFCKYVLEDPSTAAMLLAVSYLPQFIGQAIDFPMMWRFEGTKLGLIGNIIMMLGCLLGLIFGTSSLQLLQLGIILRNFGKGMINGIRGSLLPRVVEYGEWKFDVRQDGMVQGGNSVIQKIVSALITIVVGAVLTITGYVGGGSAVPLATIRAIKAIFLQLPFYCSVISLVFYLRFDLTAERIKEMRAEIIRRRKICASTD